MPPMEDYDDERSSDKKHRKKKKSKKDKKNKKEKKNKKRRHADEDDDAEELAQLEKEIENERPNDQFVTEGQHLDEMLEGEGGPPMAEEDMRGDEVLDMRTESAKAAQIIDEMAACIEDDIESNKNNRPALKKLAYSPELLKSLKHLRVQERFLDMGGCKYLADWLSKLPDGSFPCLNIIEIGLEIVDFLPIEKEHLMESKLGKALEKIRKMKGGNDAIKRKSQEIINKWKRQILNMDAGFDESGRHEEQYREFKMKKQLEAELYRKVNKRKKVGEDDDDESPAIKQEEKKGEGEGDDLELKKQK